MSRRFIVSGKAEADIQSAWRWYEQQAPGLGDQFLAELDSAYAQIQRMPEAPAIVYRGLRHVLLRRFRYGVYYRVGPDRIRVIAVYHSSRDPKGWQRRT